MGPKSRNLHFLPEAKQDIADAFAWYEEQSLGLGLEFLRCLEATIESVERHPLMHPVVFGEYRRALVRRFPYVVFYEINASRAVVHAIFHCAQDPNKWKGRLTN